MTEPDFNTALPPRSLVTAYLSRGLQSWCAVRLVLAAVLLMNNRPPIHVDDAAVVGIPVLSVIVGYIDVTRRGERVLLANLGISSAAVLVPLMVPGIIGEIVLAMVRQAVGDAG